MRVRSLKADSLGRRGGLSRGRSFAPLLVGGTTMALMMSSATLVHAATAPDDAPVLLNAKGEHENGAEDQNFAKLLDAYYSSRVLAGDQPLTLSEAASARSRAVAAAAQIPQAVVGGPGRGGTWVNAGPDPIVQVARTSNTFAAMSGRIGALAIRNNGTIILGAAQGGVWTYDASTGKWTSRTDNTGTQAVGALAVAPSNDQIVYMGSGEGSLAGDSYYGDGIYRSDDGGVSWKHVSSTFTGQAVTDLAVDPTDPQHVYASTARGRGGARRTTSPTEAAYGVWESTDGGAHWALRKGTSDDSTAPPIWSWTRSIRTCCGHHSGATGSTARPMEARPGRARSATSRRTVRRVRHALLARPVRPCGRIVGHGVRRLRLLRLHQRVPPSADLEDHR